jgi:uncharacterized membrane protein
MNETRPVEAPAEAALAGPKPSPTTAGEYITLLAHYHRAEIARMAGWRDRVDRTTHWAITAVGAMLSVSLSAPSANHGIMLLAMLLVALLLVIEARRYRFFDVYRTRVRVLERNWYAPIFAGEGEEHADWLRAMAETLRRPGFQISLNQALSRRVRRTYGWMYLILLGAWLLKTTAHNPSKVGYSQTVATIGGWFDNARLGPIPGWAIVAAVAALYGWLLYLALRRYPPSGELAHGEVHF